MSSDWHSFVAKLVQLNRLRPCLREAFRGYVPLMFADISQETVTTFWIVAVTLFLLVGGLTIRAARKRRH